MTVSLLRHNSNYGGYDQGNGTKKGVSSGCCRHHHHHQSNIYNAPITK